MDETRLSLSPIDEMGLGVRTARAMVETPEDVGRAIDFCHEKGVTLLIARCPAAELRAAQAMERQGFELMDVLIYYSHNLRSIPPTPAVNGVAVRSLRPGDEREVRDVASEAFRDYTGHYHADPRLDRAKCDEAYASWAYRACTLKEVAQEVLVAELDGGIVGFVALRASGVEEIDGALFAVAPRFRGIGIAPLLMVVALHLCHSKGAARMTISTQIGNLAAQRLWVRLGFAPRRAFYTFHRWFDS